MIELNRDDYILFTSSEFERIIGQSLSSKLQDRGSGQEELYFRIYASNLIRSAIMEYTSHILEKKYEDDPNDYELYLRVRGNLLRKLSRQQIENIKLACIYQADFIIENGSPERMLGVAIGEGQRIDKKHLKEFELSSLALTFLTASGVLYTGLGGGTYEWIK